MADITPFNFGIFTVRVINRDNQPWFVANDICNALGYSNTSKAIGDHLDEDERMTVTASDGQSFDSNQPLESFSKGVASSDTLKLPLEMGVLSFVQNVDKELRNGGKASTCGIHAGI